MGKQFVKDLKIGTRVQSDFVVADIREISYSAPSKSGETFFKLLLGDNSGTIKGIIWDRSLVAEPIRPDDVLRISGEVNEYHGPQLVVQDYQKVSRKQVNRRHFQPSCEKDFAEMWNRLQQVTSRRIENTFIQRLLQAVYDDPALAELFQLAPAAKTIHHNYLGGLLEHTLEVVEICEQIIEFYRGKLDASLLLTAAILHDIGKIEEYNLDSLTFQQTDRGRLLGHISIGLAMVREKIKGQPDFPADLQLALEHLLLSHHGEKEWGSPEVPQTFEAFALFHADLLSARLKQFSQVMESSGNYGSGWTDWDRFLGRRIYMGFLPRDQD